MIGPGPYLKITDKDGRVYHAKGFSNDSFVIEAVLERPPVENETVPRLSCGCPEKPVLMYSHTRGCKREEGQDW